MQQIEYRVGELLYHDMLIAGFPVCAIHPSLTDIMSVFNDGVQNMGAGMDYPPKELQQDESDDFLWWFVQTDMVTEWHYNNPAIAAGNAFVKHNEMLNAISKVYKDKSIVYEKDNPELFKILFKSINGKST